MWRRSCSNGRGQIVHRESQTFDRKQVARAWIARRETELSEGVTGRSKDVRLGDVIDRYVRESERAIGRTKAQVLSTIKAAIPVYLIWGNHDAESRITKRLTLLTQPGRPVRLPLRAMAGKGVLSVLPACHA
jgi:hypothetical protein